MERSGSGGTTGGKNRGTVIVALPKAPRIVGAVSQNV